MPKSHIQQGKSKDKRFIIRRMEDSMGDTEIIHKKTRKKWLHRVFGMFNREGYVSAIFGAPINKQLLDFLDKEAKLIK
jgi:hypothetical protein